MKTIFKSTLAAAEASFNSSFGVITKIQESAEIASEAATAELLKAEIKRDRQQIIMNNMASKAHSYANKARKISVFIESLDD